MNREKIAESKDPLVSILVPTYNHELYIEECLESIAAQVTDFDYEILVGEDCSTDNTREVVTRCAERHPKCIIPVLYEKNVGGRDNNANLRNMARGKYIARCEGDDFWHCKDKLAKQISILEKNPEVSLVCCDVDAHYTETGRIIRAVQRRIGQWSSNYSDQTGALLTKKISVFTCTSCARMSDWRKMYEENPEIFSKKYPMADIQAWLELSHMGKIVHIPESMCTYRVLKSSASRSESADKMSNFYAKSLEIHEYYALKFLCSKSVLDSVQKDHFNVFMDLALEKNSSEGLDAARNILKNKGFKSVNIKDHFNVWAAQTSSYLSYAKKVYPFLKKWDSIIRRFNNILRRLSRKINRVNYS